MLSAKEFGRLVGNIKKSTGTLRQNVQTALLTAAADVVRTRNTSYIERIEAAIGNGAVSNENFEAWVKDYAFAYKQPADDKKGTDAVWKLRTKALNEAVKEGLTPESHFADVSENARSWFSKADASKAAKAGKLDLHGSLTGLASRIKKATENNRLAEVNVDEINAAISALNEAVRAATRAAPKRIDLEGAALASKVMKSGKNAEGDTVHFMCDA